MAAVYIGSARHDENGKLAGRPGDQLQTGSGNDFKGEVSMQAYYVHKYGWNGLRAKKVEHRHKIAERMVKASNNENLGYSQSDRLGVIKKGIDTKEKANCDCGTLLREVIKEATGKDPGNFTTADAKKILLATGLFEEFEVKKESDLMTGDILISKKKSHCAVVILGKDPGVEEYYPKYNGFTTSIVSALASVGEKDTSMNHRKKIAVANGISNYQGTIKQNLQLVALIKQGKLKKA